MARLFGRRFSVVVADSKGKGLELGALRCRFTVRQFEASTPNNCDLHITNLSKATAERMVKEFSRVQISAGYDGQFGVIFDGTIVQSRRGRDTPTDTYLHIVAADGDQAHNFATVSKTLAAGSTQADAHKVVLTAMAPYGVAVGHTDPKLAGTALPRGRVLFGMGRDVMHDIARTTQTRWSIQTGRMDVVSRDGYLPNEAVKITADTGMIGLPVITPDGIIVRCLLNPLFRINSLVKLDNASIQEARVGLDIKAGGAAVNPVTGAIDLGPAFKFNLPTKDADGLYKVLAVDHTGDTRGNDFYSDLACVSKEAAATPAQRERGRGGEAPQPIPLPKQG